MTPGSVSAEELATDIRSLTEQLAARLAERLGDDIVRGPCQLELQFVDGRLRWLSPRPQIPASVLGVSPPS